jgi:hypothetical protein
MPLTSVRESYTLGDMEKTITHEENEIIRLAMEFIIANRKNGTLHLDSEYRALSDACEKEYSRRSNFAKEVTHSMGRAVLGQSHIWGIL